MLASRTSTQRIAPTLLLAALAFVFLAACGLVGCTEEQDPPKNPDTQQARTFSDSCGRTVELPDEIERVAVSNAAAQEALIALAPELLCGLSGEVGKSEAPYVDASLAKLPVFGQLYGGEGVYNKEALEGADPQLVIDIGEHSDANGAGIDALQEQTGIPCVHIDCKLDSLGQMFRTLGDLLQRQQRASELSDYCSSTYTYAMHALGSNRKGDELRIAYLVGVDALHAMPEKSAQAAAVDAAGNNVMKLDYLDVGDSGVPTSAEQVALWEPSLILFGSARAYKNVPAETTWKSMAAIKDHAYYLVPRQPCNWLSSPIGANQLLGLQWLACLRDPKGSGMDLQARVSLHMETVYSHKLTNAEYKSMVKNALP